jgi:hypothetical protein
MSALLHVAAREQTGIKPTGPTFLEMAGGSLTGFALMEVFI